MTNEVTPPSNDELWGSLDEFGQGVVKKYSALVKEYNELISRKEALGGDPQLLLENLRETSEDENVVKIRERISEITSHLFELEQTRDQILMKHVEQMRAQSATELETIEGKEKEIGDQIKASRKYIKAVLPAAEALLPKQTPAKRSGAGSSGSKRVRNRVWYVQHGDNDDALEFENASSAAKELKTDTGALQTAFFNAAGGDDSSKWDTSVSFQFGDATVISEAAE